MTGDLAITRRCLIDDLGCREPFPTLEELASTHPIVEDFVERRSQSPIGQEAIQGLRTTAYSLHSGRYRGLTWHSRRADTVWLLAAIYHRSGDANDAYPAFRELDARGQLFPTADDLRGLVRARTTSLAGSLLSEAPEIRARVLREPGPIFGVIGGRIPVRVIADRSEPRLITVAVSQRVRPGNTDLPHDWRELVAAAFIQGSNADDVEMVETFDGSALESDEIAFRGFV